MILIFWYTCLSDRFYVQFFLSQMKHLIQVLLWEVPCNKPLNQYTSCSIIYVKSSHSVTFQNITPKKILICPFQKKARLSNSKVFRLKSNIGISFKWSKCPSEKLYSKREIAITPFQLMKSYLWKDTNRVSAFNISQKQSLRAVLEKRMFLKTTKNTLKPTSKDFHYTKK